MNLEKYQQYSRIARGLEKADLVLKDARIVNVFTEEIIRGDIAIQDGIIAGIGSFHGKEERDLAGRYVCPGFIDSHLHLESTLVTPAELVTAASRHGTTTFIVDPHESANVSGLAGIDYILDQTEDVKANVYVMMPSCVPATAIDDNGCTLTAEDMVPYLHNSRILGLGEVMDSISVVQGEKSMHDKLELFEGRIRELDRLKDNLDKDAAKQEASDAGKTCILCIILFLPVTYTMRAIPGMMFLLGIYCAGGYGGSVSAICINFFCKQISAVRILPVLLQNPG